jgi:hypothetical protein
MAGIAFSLTGVGQRRMLNLISKTNVGQSEPYAKANWARILVEERPSH